MNIVFNDIIFGDMYKHFLVKYLVDILYILQRGPINQDGGSTSITHGSQKWNRVQWLSFCVLRQSHTVRSSKPSPPKFFVGQKTLTTQFKKEKRKPSPSPRHKNPHPARQYLGPSGTFPIHTCTSSSASMHGTAYRGGNHLARRLPPPPGFRQSQPHFATSACRRLSPSTFSTLLAVDPAPLGWGICRTEGSFSWRTR